MKSSLTPWLMLNILSFICSSELYDLDADPHESTALNSTDYNLQITEMESACDDWAEIVIQPTEIDMTGSTEAWDVCGGICSWKISNYSTIDVEQIYTTTDAPHIVFVLVDDWGYNYAGYKSTFMSWTTPTIDKLAGNGIKLGNYFTSPTCVPARAAFLTGRYPLRTGMYLTQKGTELPLTEITIAQEMKSAGYVTYLTGKWHMGYSTNASVPTARGFDYFYGYYNGYTDYYTKQYGTYLDLQDGDTLVTDKSEISSDLHNGYLLERKAEEFIAFHSTNHPDDPMFLYYAMQLVHYPFEAPSTYTDRCANATVMSEEIADDVDDQSQSSDLSLCGMNLMMDEAIANLTCTLDSYGMSSNTVMIVVGDNGADSLISGGSYPYRGSKGSTYRGGVSVNGFIYSQLIDEDRRGTTYDGLIHVTDWLPTLMSLATNGQWNGSLVGAELDGVDVLSALLQDEASNHTEIAHYVDNNGTCSYQLGMTKFQLGTDIPSVTEPAYNFTTDLYPEYASYECELTDDEFSAVTTSFSLFEDTNSRSSSNKLVLTVFESHLVFALLLCVLIGWVVLSLRKAKQARLWGVEVNHKYTEIPTYEFEAEGL